MEDVFIEGIEVNKVRNLSNLNIALSETERKHLIITGKNGSGKTSLLEEIKQELVRIKSDQGFSKRNCKIKLNRSVGLNALYLAGKFINTHFPAKRDVAFDLPTGFKRLDLKKSYLITEIASKNFVQYIVNLKADRSFAKDDNDLNTAEKIDQWFEDFERAFFSLFDEENMELVFDRRTYNFLIKEPGKELYNFNQLSAGYSAILSIVTELILRMEEHHSKSYDVQGVVLIDEIETHLHIDLQKKILPFLTAFFPKVQFIVTTHSPFVLNSIENAVICDLEKRIVTTDLSGYSYDTIIESYFGADKYSDLLKRKIERYEQLTDRSDLSENEKEELLEIRKYVKEIPKFMSDELAVKLQQIKLKELAKRAIA